MHYCYNCNDFVEVYLVTKDLSLIIADVTITCIVDILYCQQCKSEVYNDVLHNKNTHNIHLKYVAAVEGRA